MRCRLVLSWAVAAGTIAGFAAAQTSSPAFTKIGGKSSTATKPLTPKSPIATHHAYAASTSLPASSAKTRTELSQVDIDSLAAPAERYRVSILRGNILRTLGQAEAALPFLERALDLAHEMRDDTRSLHAMLWLARIYTNTGNLDRASSLLENARRLAMMLGDEAALVEVEGRVSDVADRQGNGAEERRASLAALAHAKRAGSNKWLAQALVNLGDSYLKTRDFAESLKYSKQALTLVSKLR